MALGARSLFLYGIQVTETNRSIDFVATSGGPEIRATMTLGFYSLTGLMIEITRAMGEADLNNVYTVTADRTISGGAENRITIQNNGAFLSLLFGTGSRAASSVCSLIGFTSSDKTGATSYTSSSTTGSALSPPFYGNGWIEPDFNKKNFGTLNVTPTGRKEAIVYSTQRFWQVQFSWIPYTQKSQWSDLMTWLIAQKTIDFTPEITSPSVFFQGSLEGTPLDAQGLAFTLIETPKGTGLYDTGLLKFRVKD